MVCTEAVDAFPTLFPLMLYLFYYTMWPGIVFLKEFGFVLAFFLYLNTTTFILMQTVVISG